jgi:CubicO group peptidase (beta-lactamase class C family)
MNFDKLTEYLDNLDETLVPGCDCRVILEGKEAYRHSKGYSDYERTKPVSDRDVYWLYSCSKVATVTAAMHLVEKGIISLSDKVSKYLPAFEKLTVATESGVVPAKNVMTVRELFSMSAGLDYDLSRPEIAAIRGSNMGTVEVVSLLAKKPLMFEPGTFYQYSLAHDVLAAVCEVAQGKRWCEYLQDYMFDPLGMTDTGFRMNDETRARLAAQYWYNYDTKKAEVAGMDNSYALTTRYDSGGAGLYSTASDYSKLVTALSLGGVTPDGYRLLKESSVNELKTCRLSPAGLKEFYNQKPGYGYALGVRTLLNPKKAGASAPRGEFGWDGAAGSYLMMDNKNHIGVMYCEHVLGCGPAYDIIHPNIRNIVYNSIK